MGSSSWSGTDTYTGYQGFLKNYGETVAPGGEFVSWSSLVGGSSGPPPHFFTLTFADLSNSRATSAFQDTLGNGTQMLLLGPGVTRQEPNGFLRENAVANGLAYSQMIGYNAATDGYGSSGWTALDSGGIVSPVVTLNSADVLAPDGTQTASKWVLPGVSGAGQRSAMYPGATTGTGNSVWARTLTGTAQITLTDGTPTGIICNVTSTWQRFFFVGGSGFFVIGQEGAIGGGTVLAACTVYLWGAQSETTAFPTSYFPTNTNILAQSQAVGDSSWDLQGDITIPTVTLNTSDVLAPDGTQTASKVVFPSISPTDYAFLDQQPGVNAPFNTLSIWLRLASGTATFPISIYNGAAVTNCAVTATWQRFSVSYLVTGANSYIIIGPDGRIGQTPFAGTIYMWGAQAEVGSVPSSYFYVAGTSAVTTRATDLITFANPLNPSNPTNWGFGALLTPLGTWSQIFSAGAGVPLWLQTPSPTLANTWRAIAASTVTDIQFDTWDNSATLLSLSNSAAVSGSNPVTVAARNVGGALSMTPGATTSSGTGTGVISVQPTPLTLGYSADPFQFQGWVKNMYMDNT